ncbi:MAG: energy transducer TonB [Sphingomonas sp.]|uniref:energy transducer TonB n=1 Tax=Sphingomonas sp. TaxID=28214 RepID=UPI0022730D0C|nr:energy transducer TonB [Sphingomonas sp.]MCX8477342.1 energy transducer TonB [Sphingomonas sp.]
MLLGAALFIAAVAPGAAVAREPEVLAQTGKWVINYDQDACHLLAEFGAGEAAVSARFTRFEPGDSFMLALYGDRLRSTDATADVKIDFGLVRAEKVNALLGSFAERPTMLFVSLRFDGAGWATGKEPPAIPPEQEAKVSGVTIDAKGRPSFRLQFGSLAKPLRAMRTCLTDLVRSWGYDPAVEAALSRRAKPTRSPASWFESADYPREAARLGLDGSVQFRLDVDAAGRIGGCHILARTNPDDFADATCRAILKRARFEPALDAQQKPVRSFFVGSTRFKIVS